MYKKGKVIKVTVTGIENYGIFVSCDDYYTGLIHISEISHDFVKDVNDFVKIGDIIYAEIVEVEEELSRLKLSIKNIDYKKNVRARRKKIDEAGSGFDILKKKLPEWVESAKKKSNYIDKDSSK